MGEDLVGLRRVPHVLLHAEVRHRDVDVQRGGHAHGREVGGAVRSGSHVIELGKVEDLAQMADASGVNDRGPDVVDELLGDQLPAVPDGVEHLADGDRDRRVLADQPKAVLELGRAGVLQPERVVVLEALAEPRRLHRRQAMVHVVQDVQVEAEALPHRLEESGHRAQVRLGRPPGLGRTLDRGRLVEELVLCDAVDRTQTRDADLHANRLVAHLAIGGDLLEHLGDGLGAGVPVDHDAIAGPAAQQLVDGHPGRFALEVPQRGVDRRDRGHRDGPAPPVGALVQVLPGVLDAVPVAADQQRADVIDQIAGNRQLAAVKRRVPHAGQSVVGRELERDEVAARAADDHLGVDDPHRSCTQTCRGSNHGIRSRPSPASAQR